MPEQGTSGIDASTRRQLLSLVGGGAAASLAGCAGIFDDGGDGDGPGGTVEDVDEIPMDGQFTASIASNPSTFDPTITGDATSTQMATMQYEQLVQMDWNVQPQPALATDWEQEDETTYRFDLREGVEFHTGEELTAADVAHSFRRVIGTVNDATVSTWYEDSEVVDDYTIRFHLSQPHAPLLADVNSVFVVPESETSEDPGEDDHDFTAESIGTGPFVIDNVQPDDRVEFVRNDDYWFEETENMPGRAPWESLTFRVVTEQTAQEAALQSGELDLIDNANPINLDSLDSADATNVVSTTGLGFDFISFPVNHGPYTNPKFRRGITRLIPVQDVIEAVWSGYAVEQAGPISPGLTDFYDEEFEQQLLEEYVGEDREAAEQLLEEAFEEEDVERPFEIGLITNINATRERWMEVIQQTLDETEYFDASLDVRPFDSMVDFLLSGDAAQSDDLVGIGWTGGSDPHGHVDQIIHSDNHVGDGGFNWNLYENEEVDQLIDDARRETDPEARADLYEDLSELLAQEVPSAFMWTSEEYAVHRTEAVANWQQHPNASFFFLGLYRPYVDQVAYPPA